MKKLHYPAETAETGRSVCFFDLEGSFGIKIPGGK